MWICPACGEEIDRTDHIMFVDGIACCRVMYELYGDEGEEE